MNKLKPKLAINNRGDTIVEVLISIAIAAFAIGTSYAIANRSLQQAITARERNEAVNLTQSQIAALKLRFIANKDAFDEYNASADVPAFSFVIPSTEPKPPDPKLPYSVFYFCLDEASASKDDTTNQWARIPNGFANDSDADDISATNTYNPGNGGNNPGCVRHISGTDYFINISAQITKGSKDANKRTVYKVDVRWPQVGSGITAQSTVYYRL